MFRALTCPSSGEKIVFTQHLVPSLSVNACTVHWLRADFALNQFTVQAFTESEDTRCCVNTIFSTLSICYKNQSVSSVQGKYLLLVWE